MEQKGWAIDLGSSVYHSKSLENRASNSTYRAKRLGNAALEVRLSSKKAPRLSSELHLSLNKARELKFDRGLSSKKNAGLISELGFPQQKDAFVTANPSRFSLQTWGFHEILSPMKPERAANAVSGASTASKLPATDPITVFSVLTHPLRLKLLRILAGARPISATEAAEVLHQDVNIVLQQFKILRQSGIVATAVSSEDARVLLYYIPPTRMAEVNVLKLDFCVIDFAAIPDYPIRKRRR